MTSIAAQIFRHSPQQLVRLPVLLPTIHGFEDIGSRAQSVQWDYQGNRYNGDITSGDARLVCFTRGTLIKTDQGERPIEDLAAGDMVLTMDHGISPYAG